MQGHQNRRNLQRSRWCLTWGTAGRCGTKWKLWIQSWSCGRLVKSLGRCGGICQRTKRPNSSRNMKLKRQVGLKSTNYLVADKKKLYYFRLSTKRAWRPITILQLTWHTLLQRIVESQVIIETKQKTLFNNFICFVTNISLVYSNMCCPARQRRSREPRSLLGRQ